MPDQCACLARTASHAIMEGLRAGAQTPGPEASSDLPDPSGLVPPPTQPSLVTIRRHVKGAFCTNARIWVCTLSALLVTLLFSSLQTCSQSIRRLPNALQNEFPIIKTLGRMNVSGLRHL